MRFCLSTKGFTDIINITPRLSEIVAKSGVKAGICVVSSAVSTCGITTIEYEEGVIKDLKEVFEKIASRKKNY